MRSSTEPGPVNSATFAVTVHNDRSVGMKELKVGPAGDPNLKKVVGPLAFGRKTVIHLKRTKDCLYDIHGEFADDADTDQSQLHARSGTAHRAQCVDDQLDVVE